MYLKRVEKRAAGAYDMFVCVTVYMEPIVVMEWQADR